MRFATFFDTFLKQKTHQNILIHLILNFEFGDVTIVTDDEQIKALKYVLRFDTFFDTFLKQTIHQYNFINLSLNFELGDITIVADDEQ